MKCQLCDQPVANTTHCGKCSWSCNLCAHHVTSRVPKRSVTWAEHLLRLHRAICTATRPN